MFGVHIYNNNIPNDEGLAEFRKALDSRKDKSISTDFLVELLELVLTLNISEFDKKLFLQLIGTAMGTDAAPTYANIFMAAVDKWLEGCAQFKDRDDFSSRYLHSVLVLDYITRISWCLGCTLKNMSCLCGL